MRISYKGSKGITTPIDRLSVDAIKPYQKTALHILYKYRNTKLETANSATLLAVDLDTHLNWKFLMSGAINNKKKLTSLINYNLIYYICRVR